MGASQERDKDQVFETRNEPGQSREVDGRPARLLCQVNIVYIYFDHPSNHAKSKAQYVRQLSKWQVKKNSKGEEWKFIAHRLRKRDREGKDSETYINGELVPRKKIKKEISRHVLPRFERDYNFNAGQLNTYNAPSPATPEGIMVCTPAAASNYAIDVSNLPCFEFENLLERYCSYTRCFTNG